MEPHPFTTSCWTLNDIKCSHLQRWYLHLPHWHSETAALKSRLKSFQESSLQVILLLELLASLVLSYNTWNKTHADVKSAQSMLQQICPVGVFHSPRDAHLEL